MKDILKQKRERLIQEMKKCGYEYDPTKHPDHIDILCKGCFKKVTESIKL